MIVHMRKRVWPIWGRQHIQLLRHLSTMMHIDWCISHLSAAITKISRLVNCLAPLTVFKFNWSSSWLVPPHLPGSWTSGSFSLPSEHGGIAVVLLWLPLAHVWGIRGGPCFLTWCRFEVSTAVSEDFSSQVAVIRCSNWTSKERAVWESDGKPRSPFMSESSFRILSTIGWLCFSACFGEHLRLGLSGSVAMWAWGCSCRFSEFEIMLEDR